jgi:hypothetical protein
MHGKMKNALKILVEKSEGKTAFAIERHWYNNDNINMDIKEIGHDSIDWLCLNPDTETNLCISYDGVHLDQQRDCQLSFPRRPVLHV